MIQFQFATIDQAPLIADFARQVWTEHYTPIIGIEQVDYMLNKYQSPEQISTDIFNGYVYDVAWADDEIIGYCAYRLDEKAVFLSKLYIARKKRGQKIANQFLDRLQETARQNQKSSIWLTVNKQNPSLSIYQKMGFIIKDSVITDIGAGFVMDDYIMELRISITI